jgi:hypothetical protein
MSTIMLFLFVIAFLAIAYNARENIYAYNKAKRQNDNFTADNYYRKAVIYSILCIIFVISFACNREEFHLSNNQFINYPMSEQSNATTADDQSCPWVVNEHGSTIARVNSKI